MALSNVALQNGFASVHYMLSWVLLCDRISYL